MTLNLRVFFLTRSLSHWSRFLAVFRSLKMFHVEIATRSQQPFAVQVFLLPFSSHCSMQNIVFLRLRLRHQTSVTKLRYLRSCAFYRVPEICTMQIINSAVLHIVSNMSNPITADHFSTSTLVYNLFCGPLVFIMCLQSCAFAHIIGPTFSWLRQGFLNSRTALSLTHCILLLMFWCIPITLG